MNKSRHQISDPTEWTEKYGDYLFNFAISRVYNRELAEDMVQDTFLSALKSRQNFKGKSKERTWLISILKNKIIDHYRKVGTSRERTIIDNNWEITGEESPFRQEEPFKGNWKKDSAPGSTGLYLEDMLEKEEFQTILEKCLSDLPEKWGAAFTLKVIEEIEGEKVCKDLNITSSNLWVILHRARLKLRECLEKRWMQI